MTTQGQESSRLRAYSFLAKFLAHVKISLQKIMLKKRKMNCQQRLPLLHRPLISILTFTLVIFVLTPLIAFAFSNSFALPIQNSGSITLVGLDAYGGDIHSANGVLSVDLGEIYAGRTKSISFYLRSISNSPTTLVFNVDNWKPESLERFMHVSWNYSGKQIAPNEEIFIRIDINTVPSADFFNYLYTNKFSSFSFSLTIEAVKSGSSASSINKI